MDKYQDPEKLTEAMKAGLAHMYADNDIRAYLIHMVNVYNHNALIAVRGGENDKARDFTAKFDTMKRLLENGKAMFVKAEQIRSKTLEEQMKLQQELNKPIT